MASSDDGGVVDTGGLVREACAAFAQAACENLELCEPSRWGYASVSDCTADFARICVPSYTADVQLFGAAFIEASRACYAAEVAVGPSCAPKQNVTAGDLKSALAACAAVNVRGSATLNGKCFVSENCGPDLACAIPDGGRCGGSCVPAATAGERCKEDFDCLDSLYCERASETCKSATIGDSCSGGTCGRAVHPSFACNSQKVCAPWGTLGDTCGDSSLSCNPFDALYCASDKTCHTIPTQGLHAPCTDGKCAGAYTCVSEGTCELGANADAGCDAVNANACDTTQGLACVAGRCALSYPVAGEPCQPNGAACWRGTCTAAEAGAAQYTCVGFAAPGEACVHTSGGPACFVPYSCIDGKCQLPLDAGVACPQ